MKNSKVKITRKGKDFYINDEYVGSIDGDRDWGYCFEYADGKSIGVERYDEPFQLLSGNWSTSCGTWKYFMDAVRAIKQILIEEKK
jgi:hypothetical protein